MLDDCFRSRTANIDAPTWNCKIKLLDSSYSISDIEDYFEYIIKNHETVIDNPPIRINVNKIENRVLFKIKTGYYLELLTPETMKLLGSTKNKIIKDENGENMPHLEITEVVKLSIVKLSTMIINILQDSCPHKQLFVQLDISPKNLNF